MTELDIGVSSLCDGALASRLRDAPPSQLQVEATVRTMGLVASDFPMNSHWQVSRICQYDPTQECSLFLNMGGIPSVDLSFRRAPAEKSSFAPPPRVSDLAFGMDRILEIRCEILNSQRVVWNRKEGEPPPVMENGASRKKHDAGKAETFLITSSTEMGKELQGGVRFVAYPWRLCFCG